jgi:hypothetical protein
MIAERMDAHITVWSKRGGLILLGWFASSAYHGTMDLNQKARTLQHVQQVDIPKLKKAVHCEDARANKSAAVAGQAILGANIDSVPVPKFRDIPADNCPHVAIK